MFIFFVLICISCFCPPKAATIGATTPDQSRARFEFEVRQSLIELTTIAKINTKKLENLEEHLENLEKLEQLEQLANFGRHLERLGLNLPAAPTDPQPTSPTQLGAAIPLPPALRFVAQMTEEVAIAVSERDLRSCCCSRRNCSRASVKEGLMNCPKNFQSFIYNYRASMTALFCGLPFEVLGLMAVYQQLKTLWTSIPA